MPKKCSFESCFDQNQWKSDTVKFGIVPHSDEISPKRDRENNLMRPSVILRCFCTRQHFDPSHTDQATDSSRHIRQWFSCAIVQRYQTRNTLITASTHSLWGTREQ